MLKEILKGEPYANRLDVIDVEAKLARASFTVKPSKDSQSRYVLNWDLDFSGCTDEELILLASRQIKVDIASKWRGDPDRQEASKWDQIVIDVAEQLRAKPAKQSTAVKVDKLIDKMSEAEKAELIAKLTAS
jgi:hypothetical protein